ncbi:CaiB/BaiF CoA transferase family protein [Ramlibacter sp.]|uniref:CaiB/BaiF CoA transferase family protein n=1 Tax=Ramlibacter sp. TaxID=1917967 RepID=UPI002FC8E320
MPLPEDRQPHDSSRPPVLSGVRILDMATFLAAPFAATLCADLGAEVVKLELPSGVDPLRSLAPVKGDLPIHSKVSNRGKLGITLDVRKPDGRAVFLRLLPSFDVLVENFRTGTLDSWGLDLRTLHAANPRLIVLRVTGFGQTGPYARRPGFARIFEAMSGFANLIGEPDGSPQHMNYALGDMIAGLFGAFSITAALVEHSRCPQAPGREIDLSATEAMLRLLETLPAEFEQLGIVRQRSGARATYTAPSNIYKTADGTWVTIVASSDAIFRRICCAMERQDLLQDPRFATLQLRVEHLQAIDSEVAAWCASQPFDAIARGLAQNEVPFNKVNSIADVFEEPQFRARNAIVRMEDPDLGSLPAPCVVPRYSGSACAVPRSGPGVGEHTEYVLERLGIPRAELDQLRAVGAI